MDCAKHKQFISMIATLCLSHFLLYSSFPSLEHVRNRILWISCYIVKYKTKKKRKRDHFCGIKELKWDEEENIILVRVEEEKLLSWVLNFSLDLQNPQSTLWNPLMPWSILCIYVAIFSKELKHVNIMTDGLSTPTCRQLFRNREILINRP